MTNRLKKFVALTPRHKWIFVQAWLMLGWYRAGVLLLSFKRLTRNLQHHALPMPPAQLSEGQQQEALMVAEREERRMAVDEVTGRIEKVTVGIRGGRLEMLGLTWVAVGLIAANLPGIVAAWLAWLLPWVS